MDITEEQRVIYGASWEDIGQGLCHARAVGGDEGVFKSILSMQRP